MKKKLTEGNDRVKMAAVSGKKKFLKEASEGKVCPSLYLVEQFVTRCDEGCRKTSLSGKISVEKHKEIESEERKIQKIQGREKSFPSYGRVRIVSSKRRFVKLMISCVGTEHVPVRKSHPLSVT